MRRFVTLAVLMSALAMPVVAQSSSWSPDQAHSEVDFSILHLAISKVHGRFGNISGEIILDKADISKSKANVTIDVSSLDTGMSSRDSVLKSDSFFDVSKFPTATFVSTSVTKNGDGLKIAGNLTLRGITRPVVLTVDGPNGPVTGPDHKQHAGFSATTEINRKDFGIGASFPTSVVGDQVKLGIDLEVIEK